MKKLVLLPFFLAFFSCNQEPNNKPMESENEFDKCKTLLLIAEDRSGSSQGSRKLNLEDYKTIGEHFVENYIGQFVVRTIGNPSPQQRDFYTFSVKKYKALKPITEDMLMSKKGSLLKKNKKITEKNEKKFEKNKEKLLHFINNEVKENILGYKPNKNKDVTNIEEALSHIENKINEPTFEEYDNIYVVIISDGKHDATKLKEKLSFSTEREMELFLINWEDKSVFKEMEPQSFEGIEGFKDYFIDLECD